MLPLLLLERLKIDNQIVAGRFGNLTLSSVRLLIFDQIEEFSRAPALPFIARVTCKVC
jgi:hypothetical protein